MFGFGLGVVVAMGMQLANGWWLDAQERIVPMQIAVAVGALVVAAAGSMGSWWPRIAWYCGGLMATWFGIVVVWVGSNIFPIVLAIAVWKSAVPVLAGAGMGCLVATVRTR